MLLRFSLFSVCSLNFVFSFKEIGFKNDLDLKDSPLQDHVSMLSLQDQKHFYDYLHLSPLKVILLLNISLYLFPTVWWCFLKIEHYRFSSTSVLRSVERTRMLATLLSLGRYCRVLVSLWRTYRVWFSSEFLSKFDIQSHLRVCII